MKYYTLCLLFLYIVIGCHCEVKNTVHLFGQLKDMGTQEVLMRYDGTASMIGDSRNVILRTDTEGRFDTLLPLERSEFYSISRNTLYLSPGDDIEVVITQNNQEAQFKGKGAEANIYMKDRLFPKGGSYLEGGANVKENFRQTRQVIERLAEIREEQLANLKGVSTEFKELERARIYADVINSYFYYNSYALEYKGKSQEEIREAERRNLLEVVPSINEKVKYLNDDRFLNVAVVRNILFYREDPAYEVCLKNYKQTRRSYELYEGYKRVSALRQNLNQKVVDDIRAYIEEMSQVDFAIELKTKLNQAARLLSGQLAPDFVMIDTAGNRKLLSDFKGEIIYMDLWATWCGPCIQESPAFTKLSKKYPSIRFLQISRDEQKESWLSYLKHKSHTLPQYNSVDTRLIEGWQLFYIPRFILIDKEQKIINAYAPRPSSDEIIPLLDSLSH
ncbi:MAG: TlpA disulfide reductase family protein [Odoribacter sp.]